MKICKCCTLFVILMLFFFCGCQSQAGQPSTEQISTNDYSTDTYMSMQSENQFDYEIKNDAVKIIGYYNNEPQVIVPEQIAGKTVEIIGDNAFYQSADTVSIVLPEGLKTIEGSAFYRCYSLEKIMIPKNVNQIGDNPFFRCSSLTAISVDFDNAFYSDINGVLLDKDKKTLIAYPEGNPSENYTIPDSVTTIAPDAFGYHCTHLKSLTIHSNVVVFPDYNIFIYPDDITLFVESGSAAEKYAKKHELKFEIIR